MEAGPPLDPKMSDCIRIKGLRLVTTLGVPAEERRHPQRVSVNVDIALLTPSEGCEDRLDRTVDYHRVAERLREVAATGERRLVETLAEDLARAILAFEGVGAVTLEVDKFILPDCESVGVRVTRSRKTGAGA